MKKLIVLLCLIFPMGMFAQEVKIAYVNTQEVFTAMPEVSTVESQLADMNQKYEAEFKKMQEEYQKKYADFTSQQDSLTENIKLRRMQELEDLRTRIQNFVPVAQEDMQKKGQELYAPIQKKMQDAIKAVGDEKGYAYILNPEILLYKGASSIDATPFVKAKLGLK
ncbi:OmpH family outer membrane protein [Parabacteroides sp. Marseille-P3160]|uniref:OmpH family outer membrane protein n=1 Tax=Parabacteroides sp. Marseille-P3160 TaxID=1917887 RepID=UPI0009BA6300|nr:OmpH family outer membrane protein [Parabacteroides sp. Marseille-P3160]